MSSKMLPRMRLLERAVARRKPWMNTIPSRSYAQDFGSPLDEQDRLADVLLTSLAEERVSTYYTRSHKPVPSTSGTDTETNLKREEMPAKKSLFKASKSRRVVQIQDKIFLAILLRDACTCPRCVDPSTTQKTFQTTDIPADIKIKHLKKSVLEGRVHITWENDLPGFKDHVSTFHIDSLRSSSQRSIIRDRTHEGYQILWDKARITEKLEYIGFDDYMTNDESLSRALWLLLTQGLLIIRNVPESEKSVEDLALRIGNIRDSLYGRTWDVRSVPDAKNVAYTAKYLGLHMDLLYMANPPGFQFLHCLKNTAEGGDSIFSDTFNAAKAIGFEHVQTLAKTPVAYQYKNNGEHYYHTHTVLETEIQPRRRPKPDYHQLLFANYSPPFQANYLLPNASFDQKIDFLRALWAFSRRIEDPSNVLEYKLQEGECVIFNNRRILHGRKQFDALGGERWLKGTYIDTDVLNSKYRVLSDKFLSEWSPQSEATYVFPRSQSDQSLTGGPDGEHLARAEEGINEVESPEAAEIR